MGKFRRNKTCVLFRESGYATSKLLRQQAHDVDIQLDILKVPSMQSLDFIDNNYRPVFMGHFGVGRKQHIGPTTPTSCRFCGKSTPEVKFHNDAHAIPEFLGNRQLILTDECDSCNSFFADKLEDHLGKFLKPFRTMGMVRGKSGYPTYRSPDKSARIEVESATNFKFIHPRGSTFIAHDPEKKELMLNLTIERHIPCAAYKALVKVALSLMHEDDLQDFSDALLWVRQADHDHMLMQPLIVCATFVPGFKPFPKTSVLLLRKKHTSEVTELPNCLMMMSFGNLQIQLVIPTRLDNPSREDKCAHNFTIPRIASLKRFL